MKMMGTSTTFMHLTPDFVGQLNLKTVTIGLNGLQVNGLERAAAKAFEAARGVGKRHAGDEPDIQAGATGLNTEPAHARPVDDPDAIAVARAEHQVSIP